MAHRPFMNIGLIHYPYVLSRIKGFPYRWAQAVSLSEAFSFQGPYFRYGLSPD
jgi:hypothetical protein